MAGRIDKVGLLRWHVVTTTNAKGWEETGRRMAQSFLARWPNEALPLTVYAEDFDPDVDGVEIARLPEWMAEFKRLHCRTPHFNGVTQVGYDYRFDAVKFAHKVAAVTEFGLRHDDGVMVWLDADTFTHSDVTVEWLEKLFPPPSYIAWLDRANSHPECGRRNSRTLKSCQRQSETECRVANRFEIVTTNENVHADAI